MKRTKICVVISMISLFSSSAFGDYLENLSLEELTQKSSYIVQAKVLSVNPNLLQKEINLPLTLIKIQVTSSIKGDLHNGENLEILQAGGYLPDGKIVTAVGTPVFSVGEDILVLLNKKNTKNFEQKYIASASSQSKFVVENNKIFRETNQKIKFQKNSELRLVSKESPMELDSFLTNMNVFISSKGVK